LGNSYGSKSGEGLEEGKNRVAMKTRGANKKVMAEREGLNCTYKRRAKKNGVGWRGEKELIRGSRKRENHLRKDRVDMSTD